MEAVVCIPVLLVMILGCMQIAHIWFARQVVQYAAYAAARVLLSTPNQNHEKAVAVNGAAWKAALCDAKAFVLGSLAESAGIGKDLEAMYPPVGDYSSRVTLKPFPGEGE